MYVGPPGPHVPGTACSPRAATCPPRAATCPPRTIKKSAGTLSSVKFKNSLTRHNTEQHRDAKKFICYFCPSTFTRKEKLKIHIKNKHPHNLEQPNPTSSTPPLPTITTNQPSTSKITTASKIQANQKRQFKQASQIKPIYQY
jgi:hypothetical protein